MFVSQIVTLYQAWVTATVTLMLQTIERRIVTVTTQQSSGQSQTVLQSTVKTMEAGKAILAYVNVSVHYLWLKSVPHGPKKRPVF